MRWELNYECGTCCKTFPAGWQARDNHCSATGHSPPRFECHTCSRFFASSSAQHQHMNDCNHFAYECSQCNETWPTAAVCKEHEINYHYYCQECDRTFQNANNIKMHLNSRTHRAQDVKCPFCHNAFTAATGVTHHLERGACPNASNMNRDVLYNFVRSRDPQGLVSKNLIGWDGTPQYEVTSRSWNGRGYECYFCHRTFQSLAGLNQHINSPVHQQALYHCPKCRQDFKTLAAVINHFESESCGFTRFDTVQHGINDFISRGRMIGY